MRRLESARRWARYLTKIVKGLANREHPILVHVIPMRRCNLSCAYCCAPYCTVNCVQQVGMFDNWRAPQTQPPLPAAAAEDRAATG